MQNNRTKRVLCQTAVYLSLLLFSLLSVYLLFRKGFVAGDDIEFHLSQSYDVYYGLKNGFFTLSTDHLAEGAFGYNTYLFYGPLPHYAVGTLYFLTEKMGSSLIGCCKAVLMISTFAAAIFTYLLGLAISKGNKAFGLIGAALSVLAPYRVFCLFCRFAFAETLGMGLLPLLFYGLYRIVHDDSYKVAPYICCIFGVTLLVLTHPYTALLAAVFGILYLLANIKGLIRALKRKHAFWTLLVSCALVLGMVFFYVIPTMAAKKSGLYIVCDSEKVWTTLAHVQESCINSGLFSGFLNLDWVRGQLSGTDWPKSLTVNVLVLGAVIGFLSALVMILADFLLKKIPHSIYFRYPLDLVVLLLPTLLFYRRIEVLFSLGIFFVLYLFLSLSKGKDVKEEKSVPLYKNPDLYFLFCSLVVLLVLILVPASWKILPSIFMQCQFAWRNWSLFDFFAVFFFLTVFAPLATKKYKASLPLLAGLGACSILLFSFGQAYPEKKVSFDTCETKGVDVPFNVVDEEYTKSQAWQGAMNEYMPLVFGTDYTPTYSNSLYSSVKRAIGVKDRLIHTVEEYNSVTFAPRALEGKGTVLATALNTPSVTLEGTIQEDNTLIQIPQFYYDGYEIRLSEKESQEETKVAGEYVDGLVAFRVAKKGSYTMQVSYVGPKAYRIGIPLFFVSFLGTVGLGVAGYVLRKKDQKQGKDVLLAGL